MWSATCEQKRDASLDETNLRAVAGNLMGGIWPRRWRWVSFELTSSYKPRKYAISILHARAPQRRSSDYYSTLLHIIVVAIRFMLPRSVRRVSELMSSSLPDKALIWYYCLIGCCHDITRDQHVPLATLRMTKRAAANYRSCLKSHVSDVGAGVASS